MDGPNPLALGKSEKTERDQELDQEPDHSALEGVGMSPKAGWYASALLYGAGGFAYILVEVATDLPIPRSIGIGGIIAALASVFWLYCARRFTYAEWGPHLRISGGIALIGFDAFAIGAPVAVILPLMLFPVLGSAYLHAPRVVIPYCVIAAIVLTAAILTAPPPATTISAINALIAFSSIALVAVWAQHQLRSMVKMHHRLATTDALTGCANVRRLHSRLKQDLIGTSGEYRIAVYAIDLDDFKQVNDRFSHTTGDQLLKAVAAGLAEELEPSDLLVRRGGDEFAIVVPVSGGRDLQNLRWRLARAVRRAREEVCPQLNPGASVGYAIHQDGESVDALLLRADEALHEAKLAAHPDRGEYNATVRNIADYRRAIAAHPDQRSPSISDDAEEVRIARWINRSLGTYSAWIVATWTSLMIATIFVLASITGLVPDLRSPAAGGLISALVGLALLCFWAARHKLAAPWLHAFVVALFALMTAVILEAGSFRADFVDLYAFPVLFAFYFLPAKQDLGYLTAGAGLFAVVLYSSDYPYPTARLLMSFLVTLMMVGMLTKARAATLAFASRAVEMSVVDPLTGVANLRGLRQRVLDEVVRSELTGKRVAVLGIDVDDFKSVNDRYSHARGDSVLKATAEATRFCLRADELVARRGGDEFAAVCVVDSASDAEAIGDRVRTEIARARSALCPDLLPTASVAVTIRESGETVDDFMARVDDRLHDEKVRSRARRDVVRVSA